MNSLVLFTDGSVHPPSRIGYGASLVVADATAAPDTLKNYGPLKRFEQQVYRSKNNLRLNHAELYQAFFSLPDQFDCTFCKSEGPSGVLSKESDRPAFRPRRPRRPPSPSNRSALHLRPIKV